MPVRGHAVVGQTAVGIGEDFAGIHDFLEDGGGARVDVPPVIELPVEALIAVNDVFLGGVELDSQNVVVVPSGEGVGCRPNAPLEIGTAGPCWS